MIGNGNDGESGRAGWGDAERPLLPDGWADGTLELEVDLGCHRGAFLAAMAERFPETRWLGVEKLSGRVERCLAKFGRVGLENAWAIRGEGLTDVRRVLPGGSVAAIHVSFPDPWPKRRHWPRRVVNRETLEDAWVLLAVGGTLRLMTDDADYFGAMERAVVEDGRFAVAEWDDGREQAETEFERKFAEIGQRVFRLALRKF
ncbi:MAG: hypothetical protein WA771_13765 [Chthoniobacterales bacterium]